MYNINIYNIYMNNIINKKYILYDYNNIYNENIL